MGSLVTDLIENVADILNDRQYRKYSQERILKAAHRAFGPLWTAIKNSEKDHLLDFVDFNTTDFTAKSVVNNVFQLNLPEYIGAVREVNPIGSGGDTHLMEFADLETVTSAASQRFHWAWDGARRLAIYGQIEGTYRIWFIRRHPTLHKGTADGGSISTIDFDTGASRTGTLIVRPDVYVGSFIQITADSGQPSNVGAIGEVTAWDGTTATMLSNWPAATSATTVYEMLTPIDDEFDSYFEWKTAEELLSRGYDQDSYALLRDRVRELEDSFYEGLRKRVPREPIYLHRNIVT